MQKTADEMTTSDSSEGSGTHARTDTHTDTHADTHTNTHTYTHKHRHTHAHTQTQTHTHRHHIQCCAVSTSAVDGGSRELHSFLVSMFNDFPPSYINVMSWLAQSPSHPHIYQLLFLTPGGLPVCLSVCLAWRPAFCTYLILWGRSVDG